MHEHTLPGCRPVPLASYLKALAVLRLVGEQVDPTARGAWHEDTFTLHTALARDALERFFLESYRPTPFVSPWSRGSGFYPHKTTAYATLQRIASAAGSRFDAYRAALQTVATLLKELQVDTDNLDLHKALLLAECRARLTDNVVPWLDAAYLLMADDPKYPPLLGTGGNDGNFDFSNNFMQRLLDLIDERGQPFSSSTALLRASLFDAPVDGLTGGAIGQFFPSGAGGANATAGFDADSLFNPWDFVLMLEGAVCFAVAPVRRFEQDRHGALAYPFTVRQSGIGYASASDDDESAARSRGEIWLPLWEHPAASNEIRALLAEGRATVAKRAARNGVDFARAVATLGIDRGIGEFQRYAFQRRNGDAFFATSLDRVRVRREPAAELLNDIDEWLDRFRRRATGDRAPASVRRTLGRLERAIVGLCRRGGPERVQQVITSLGDCERTMASTLRWSVDNHVSPVPLLSPDWLRRLDDGSTELRLAAALASIYAKVDRDVLPLRAQMEPVVTRVVRGRLHVDWAEHNLPEVAWTDGDLVVALSNVFARRLVVLGQRDTNQYPDQAWVTAALDDVRAFLEGRTDNARLARLLWGTLLIDWPCLKSKPFTLPSQEPPDVPALYGLLKLCFAGANGAYAVPSTPRIHRLASRGDGTEASRVAARRLRASGLAPALDLLCSRGDAARRAASALLFPLDQGALAQLQKLILRNKSHSGETAA